MATNPLVRPSSIEESGRTGGSTATPVMNAELAARIQNLSNLAGGFSSPFGGFAGGPQAVSSPTMPSPTPTGGSASYPVPSTWSWGDVAPHEAAPAIGPYQEPPGGWSGEYMVQAALQDPNWTKSWLQNGVGLETAESLAGMPSSSVFSGLTPQAQANNAFVQQLYGNLGAAPALNQAGQQAFQTGAYDPASAGTQASGMMSPHQWAALFQGQGGAAISPDQMSRIIGTLGGSTGPVSAADFTRALTYAGVQGGAPVATPQYTPASTPSNVATSFTPANAAASAAAGAGAGITPSPATTPATGTNPTGQTPSGLGNMNADTLSLLFALNMLGGLRGPANNGYSVAQTPLGYTTWQPNGGQGNSQALQNLMLMSLLGGQSAGASQIPFWLFA